MTIKEELFALMERIAKPWPTKTITVIICCEAEIDSGETGDESLAL